MLPDVRLPPLAAAAAAGTPIQKPTSTEEIRAIYERIKRENPSVSDIEKGNF